MLFEMAHIGSSARGFLLAGGKSSRMGAGVDKAFLEFRGQSLLDRALGVLSAVCGSVRIVGDPSRFSIYEATSYGPVVADIFSGCGPLGGIHAALVSSPAELNLMLAVDMPFVSHQLLAFLLATAASGEHAATMTVPRIGRGFQPLCAVYRREFATVAESALRARNYKVDAAFSGLPMRVIEAAELSAAGFSGRNFFNLNTPDDCRVAECGEI
jgi:molybdopterin-guanine dinucleotide biosynthesis protein A